MSTRRSDLRTALRAILEDFRASVGDALLRQTYSARPASFHPPMAFVGPFTESLEHEMGNRQRRDMRAQIGLVQGLYDNEESSEKLDVLADAFLAYLVTQHSRVSGATLLEAVSSEDVELVIKEVPYAATVITVRLNAVD